MSERMAARHLEAVLVSVGRHLDVPAEATSELDLGVGHADGVVPARLAARRMRSRTRLLAAAAVLVAVVSAAVALGPARDTVADWFGLRHVEVRYEPVGPSDAGVDELFVDDLRPIDARIASERSGIDPEVLAGTGLGEPDLTAVAPEGGVVFGWSSGSTTLWVRDAEYLPPDITKGVGPNADVERVDGLGDNAYFIEGEHLLETPARRVRAENVVWWSVGDREYRLESELPREEMVELARQLV